LELGPAVSITMVIEKPQDLRERPFDFADSWFSITVLECVFSNQPYGDGFRERKNAVELGLRAKLVVFFSVAIGTPWSRRGVGPCRMALIKITTAPR